MILIIISNLLELYGRVVIMDKELEKALLKLVLDPEEFLKWTTWANSIVVPGKENDEQLAAPSFNGSVESVISEVPSLKEELYIILLTLNEKYYYSIPEENEFHQSRLDVVLGLISSANDYGISMPLPEHRDEYYRHESGLDKEFLLQYIPDDGVSIFNFVFSLMEIPELMNSPEFIIGAWQRIGGNPDDVKDNLFSHASPELMDDEQFIIDCLANGVNNWGQPLNFASERIKKDKNIILQLCAMDGSMFYDADESFRNDRDVALIAIAKAPEYFESFSEAIQNDPVIKGMKAFADKYLPAKRYNFYS